MLAIGKDVEERIPTLYVAKNQRATIDGELLAPVASGNDLRRLC